MTAIDIFWALSSHYFLSIYIAMKSSMNPPTKSYLNWTYDTIFPESPRLLFNSSSILCRLGYHRGINQSP